MKLTNGEKTAIIELYNCFIGDDFEGHVHRTDGIKSATMMNLAKKGFLVYQKTLVHTYDTNGRFGLGHNKTHRQCEVRYTVTDKFMSYIHKWSCDEKDI